MSKSTMKKQAAIKKDEAQSYFKASRGLERDVLSELARSKKIAWRVAGGFFIISIVASVGGAAAYFRPIPDPVVLTVDSTTGAAEVLNRVDTEIKSLGEVEDEYWIRRYVLNREKYDYWNVQTYYNMTRLLSSPRVQKQYYEEYYEGEQGRDQRYGERARIDVDIRSIQHETGDNQATVRFSTQVVYENGETEPREYHIATMFYRYLPKREMTRSERWKNPYGFTVENYSSDYETVPE